MKRNAANRKVIRERLTIFLVILFCVLISSSEYISFSDQEEAVKTEKSSDSQDQSQDHKTFLHTAVDAVVPFVIAAVDHAFHLIYEIFDGENTVVSSDFKISIQNNHFFEVLFEQIISVNAP